MVREVRDERVGSRNAAMGDAALVQIGHGRGQRGDGSGGLRGGQRCMGLQAVAPGPHRVQLAADGSAIPLR